MVTRKNWVTARQLSEMPDDGYCYELVRGEIRKIAPSFEEHGLVSANVAGDLIPYVRRNGLGRVVIAETGYLLESNPDTVRAPDVSFIRQDRVSPPGDRRWFVRGAPDLAGVASSLFPLLDRFGRYFPTVGYLFHRIAGPFTGPAQHIGVDAGSSNGHDG